MTDFAKVKPVLTLMSLILVTLFDAEHSGCVKLRRTLIRCLWLNTWSFQHGLATCSARTNIMLHNEALSLQSNDLERALPQQAPITTTKRFCAAEYKNPRRDESLARHQASFASNL
jgi:hypothetical protein